MAEERIVPTGPRGAVRTTDDGSRPTVQAGDNLDPRDNTRTARPNIEADRNENVPKYGGGGVKVRAERAFWPEDQPDNEAEAKKARDEGRPIPPHREHIVREGELAEIPNDHAMDLLEKGIVKRVKDERNG